MTVYSRWDEFRTAWKPLLASSVGAACGINAIPFYTHGVFVVPVSEEFGWSRGATQFAFSFVMITAIFLAPLIGAAIDRLGARRIGIPSVLAVAIGFALLSQTSDQIATYYALWIFMALIGTGTNPVTWTKTVTSWFHRNRGLALGITMGGTGVVGTFAPVAAAYLIRDYTWRGAYLGLGLAIAAIGLPILILFFRDRDIKDQAITMGPAENKVTPGVSEGFELREAVSGYKFWAMGIAMLLICGSVSGLITNIVPLLTDKGLERTNAAGYAAMIGVSVIIGRLLAGYLVDMIWAPGVAFVFLVAPVISCFILTGDDISPTLLLIAVPLIGLAAGAELDMLAFLTAKYFGIKNYGVLYGIQFGFFSIGSGFAPAIFGSVFDVYGDYQPILFISAACFVVGALLILTMGRYPSVTPETAV